jgi:hypothetical protein
MTDLPWDSVTVVRRGHQHGPSLDQGLVEAIISLSLPESLKSEGSRARAATIAFLYLYMTLADDTVKSVPHLPAECLFHVFFYTDHLVILLHGQRNPSVLVWVLQHHIPPALPLPSFSFTNGSLFLRSLRKRDPPIPSWATWLIRMCHHIKDVGPFSPLQQRK